MGIPKATEAGFMATVVQFARLNGWLVYHTHDSRHSGSGFPDLVLVRPVRAAAPADRGVVVAELKRQDGTASADQDEWIAAFRHAGVAAFVWRPSDWPQIERVLGPTRSAEGRQEHKGG